MSGKNPRMNQIESRKQLLLAESELNRAHLLEGVVTLTTDIRTLTDRAKPFGSIISLAAGLVTDSEVLQRAKPVVASVKPSWLQTIFKSVNLISTLWLAF